MNRAARIDTAKATLNKLKPDYDRLKEQWDEAQRELRGAEKSIEPGDRVRVKILCNRGCCVEQDYEGTVMLLDTTIKSPNNFWIIRPDDQSKDRSVVEHDMERIK